MPMANTIAKTLSSVWRFYRDGFRNMTWGRPLWLLIILKIIIMFGVLRVFFFESVLLQAGDGREERRREK